MKIYIKKQSKWKWFVTTNVYYQYSTLWINKKDIPLAKLICTLYCLFGCMHMRHFNRKSCIPHCNKHQVLSLSSLQIPANLLNSLKERYPDNLNVGHWRGRFLNAGDSMLPTGSWCSCGSLHVCVGISHTEWEGWQLCLHHTCTCKNVNR